MAVFSEFMTDNIILNQTLRSFFLKSRTHVIVDLFLITFHLLFFFLLNMYIKYF